MNDPRDEELLDELIGTQERLRDVERRLDDLSTAVELALESKGSKEVNDLLRAVQQANGDALLEAHGRIAGKLAQAEVLLSEKIEQRKKVNPSLVELAVNDYLEARLRVLCGNVYEEILELPRVLRRIDTDFSDERVRFQGIINRRIRLSEELLREDVSAFLDIARSRIERTPEPDDILLGEYQEWIRKTHQAEETIKALTNEAQQTAQRCRTLREQFCKNADSIQEIDERIKLLERFITMFGIPCPSEISRQMQEVHDRLESLRGGTQSARLQVMLRFQGSIPNIPESVRELFKNRTTHAAFYLRKQPNPSRLFKDAPLKEVAIERLCVLIALLRDDDKGFSIKSIVSILTLTGLCTQDDHPLFEETLRNMIGTVYQMTRFKNHDILIATEEGRQSAKATLQASIDPEGLHYAIVEGKRAFWNIKYSGRSTGTDDES